MQISQLQPFKRHTKKLKPNQKRDLDKAIAKLLTDPTLGIRKKGDLSWVHVYKFRMVGQIVLLAYEYNDKELVLAAIGDHENFYRDLKRR